LPVDYFSCLDFQEIQVREQGGREVIIDLENGNRLLEELITNEQ
jgi:hypothetical protein